MSAFSIGFSQSGSKDDAKTFSSTNKNNHTDPPHSRQVTYKIKDGLYLATSLDAFKDDEFILLNWIEHIVVFENRNYPFDNALKSMYGQESDENFDEEQQIINYLHFDSDIFSKSPQQDHFKTNENTDDRKMDDSLIKVLGQAQNCEKFTSSFKKIHEFIEESRSLGSSCLILPSSPKQDIDDLSCVFSICTAYLMQTFKWSLYKALEFMNSRLKDVDLCKNAYEWLNKIQIQLLQRYSLTYNWESYQSTEELVLRNTFLNTKKIVCENALRKLELNGQTASREKLKSKSKFQNPSKKAILPQKLQQKEINGLKPILKDLNFTFLPLKSQRKQRIQFNISLNQIKEYAISPEKENCDKGIFENKDQQSFSKSFDSSNSSSFLSASRNKRISLCVSKIVSKYRQQRNLSQKPKPKQIMFGKTTETPTLRMTKKKSFYNFQSCKSMAVLQNKESKSHENENISKIFQKIKENQNVQQNQPNVSLTEPSIQNSLGNVGGKTSLTRKNSLDSRESTKTLNFQKQAQSTTYRSQQKLRQLNTQNISKNQSMTKYDQIKQNSIDKLNSNPKIYIKEIKTEKFFERKQSGRDNLDGQKHKEKNLVIEYEDFKQMIKKKQKSIANLVSHHVMEDKVLKEKTVNNLSSVLQKLKKDVSEIQSNMSQSNILKKPAQNMQKQPNLKTSTLKWR